MTVKSKFNGHEIKYVDGEWFFCATGLPVKDHWEKMPCGFCGKNRTEDGHDGCLGTLPGIMNACCGHGQVNEAYVQFSDGVSIHGDHAMRFLQNE